MVESETFVVSIIGSRCPYPLLSYLYFCHLLSQGGNKKTFFVSSFLPLTEVSLFSVRVSDTTPTRWDVLGLITSGDSVVRVTGPQSEDRPVVCYHPSAKNFFPRCVGCVCESVRGDRGLLLEKRNFFDLFLLWPKPLWFIPPFTFLNPSPDVRVDTREDRKRAGTIVEGLWWLESVI